MEEEEGAAAVMLQLHPHNQELERLLWPPGNPPGFSLRLAAPRLALLRAVAKTATPSTIETPPPFPELFDSPALTPYQRSHSRVALVGCSHSLHGMGQAGQRRSTADGGVTVPIRQVPSLAMLIPEQLGPAQSRLLAVVAAGAGNNTIAIASGAMTQRGPQAIAAAEVPNQAQGTAQLAAAMHKEAANVADATPVSAPGSCQPQLALGEQPRSGLFMAPVYSNQLQPARLQQAGPSSNTPTLPAACKAHMSQALVAKQVAGMQHSLSVASSKGQWGACGLLLSLLGRLKVTPEVLCSTQAAVAVAALKKCTNAATRQEARSLLVKWRAMLAAAWAAQTNPQPQEGAGAAPASSPQMQLRECCNPPLHGLPAAPGFMPGKALEGPPATPTASAEGTACHGTTLEPATQARPALGNLPQPQQLYDGAAMLHDTQQQWQQAQPQQQPMQEAQDVHQVSAAPSAVQPPSGQGEEAAPCMGVDVLGVAQHDAGQHGLHVSLQDGPRPEVRQEALGQHTKAFEVYPGAQHSAQQHAQPNQAVADEPFGLKDTSAMANGDAMHAHAHAGASVSHAAASSPVLPGAATAADWPPGNGSHADGSYIDGNPISKGMVGLHEKHTLPPLGSGQLLQQSPHCQGSELEESELLHAGGKLQPEHMRLHIHADDRLSTSPKRNVTWDSGSEHVVAGPSCSNMAMVTAAASAKSQPARTNSNNGHAGSSNDDVDVVSQEEGIKQAASKQAMAGEGQQRSFEPPEITAGCSAGRMGEAKRGAWLAAGAHVGVAALANAGRLVASSSGAGCPKQWGGTVEHAQPQGLLAAYGGAAVAPAAAANSAWKDACRLPQLQILQQHEHPRQQHHQPQLLQQQPQGSEDAVAPSPPTRASAVGLSICNKTTGADEYAWDQEPPHKRTRVQQEQTLTLALTLPQAQQQQQALPQSSLQQPSLLQPTPPGHVQAAAGLGQHANTSSQLRSPGSPAGHDTQPPNVIDTERSSPAKKPRLQPAEDHADGSDGADGAAPVLGEHLKYGAELSLHGCAMHAHAQRTAEFGQHNVSHARDHSMDLGPADKQPVGDQASVLHVNRKL